ASFQRNQLLQKEPDLRLENVQRFALTEMIYEENSRDNPF
uniref:Secretogranin II (Fragments) n=1 Tax=Sus scrofa domesticus TaxID=9825 RepID=Q7M2R7_PIG